MKKAKQSERRTIGVRVRVAGASASASHDPVRERSSKKSVNETNRG